MPKLSTIHPTLVKMSTMRAAQISRFGAIDEILTVNDDVPRPELTVSKGKILVAVHAVSLSPGDYRMSTGDTDIFKKPPSWPYIPGGDVAGVVEQVGSEETEFAVGDKVIGTWDSFGMGGIAEYTLVDTKLAIKMPETATFIEGAAMADSPSNGMLAVEDAEVKAGDRLLLLGGSGAVGTTAIQFAKNKGASFIAATSTDAELVKGLGADVVVNYREQNWWETPEWKQEPFDVVIDCAEGVTAWHKVLEHGLIKDGRQGGRFVAVVLNDWHIVIHSVLDMAKWLAPIVGRAVTSRLMPSRPKYTMLFPAPRGDSLQRCIKQIADGEVKVIVDKRSPFPFTAEGVREAFNVMIDRSAHGKIVIQIRQD